MEKNRAIYPCICTLYVYCTISKIKKFQNVHKISKLITRNSYLRNKSWKPEYVGSFNMDWRILVFYPEPIHDKAQSTFWPP
jgi:hypothetical protein